MFYFSRLYNNENGTVFVVWYIKVKMFSMRERERERKRRDNSEYDKLAYKGGTKGTNEPERKKNFNGALLYQNVMEPHEIHTENRSHPPFHPLEHPRLGYSFR